MADDEQKHGPCTVNSFIQPNDLEELLKRIVESLKLHSVDRSLKILPDWLSREFFQDKSMVFYIDPSDEGGTPEINILTLYEVSVLISSIAVLITKEPPFSTAYRKDAVPDDVLHIKNILSGYFSRDRLDLLEAAEPLLELVERLFAAKTDTKEDVQEVITLVLPPWVEEFLSRQLTSNKVISELITEVTKEVITPFLETPLTTKYIVLRSEKISPISTRDFLNNWLNKISAYFEHKNVPFVIPQYLESEKFFVVKNSIPFVTESDISILNEWLEYLKDVKAYLLLPQSAPAAYFSEVEQESESGESDLTENKDDISLESVVEQFAKAHSSYAQEAVALTDLLLPQFFQTQGFDSELVDTLKSLNSENDAHYTKIRQELTSEVERALRSLSKDELQQLREGNTAGFRMALIRRVYGKLSTNARFISYLEDFKQDYVKTLAPEQIEELDKSLKSDISDEQFDKLLEKEEWSSETFERLKKIEPNAELRSATNSDFINLFQHLINKEHNGEVSSTAGNPIDFQRVVDRLDVYIAERKSGYRLENLSQDQVALILGITIPAEFLSNPEAYKTFLLLCSEYISLRRIRLAEHYEIDAIAREHQNQGNGKFTDEELKEFENAQKLADDHKDSGGAEAIILARSSDKSRVENFTKSNHAYKDSINEIYEAEQQKRKDLNNHAIDRFSEMDWKKKWEYLKDKNLEFLPNDLENLPSNLIKERTVQQWSNQYVNTLQDYNSMIPETSSYEESDGWIPNTGTESVSGEAPSRAPIRHSTGKKPATPLLRKVLKAKDTISRLSRLIDRTKKIMAVIDKAMEAIELAATPIMGPLSFLPKPLKHLSLIGMGLAAINMLSNIFSHGIWGVGGAGIGAALGGFIGSVVPIIGTGFGAFVGGVLGSNVGAWIDNTFNSNVYSYAKNASIPNLGLGGAKGLAGGKGLGLNAAKVVPQTAVTVTKGIFGQYALPITGTGLVFGTTIFISVSQAGTFLPPDPAHGPDAQEISQYVEVTKKASPSTFQNSDADKTVTYTITITPKDKYEITPILKDTSDTIGVLGEKVDGLNFTSSLDKSQIGETPIKSDTPKSVSYTVPLGGQDVLVTNTFVLAFKVTGISDPQILRASATVVIGNPKTSCFVFGPAGVSISSAGVTQEWSELEKAIEMSGFMTRAGKNQTYLSKLCYKHGVYTPVTLYRVSNSIYGGFTPSSDEIVIYDQGIKLGIASAEYTLLHESGHIIDNRNGTLNAQFRSPVSDGGGGWSGSLFTYTLANLSSSGGSAQREAFAEGIADTVIYKTYHFSQLNGALYDMAGLHPTEYNWFVQNIFGGNAP